MSGPERFTPYRPNRWARLCCGRVFAFRWQFERHWRRKHR